jgi:hypothetical protein
MTLLNEKNRTKYKQISFKQRSLKHKCKKPRRNYRAPLDLDLETSISYSEEIKDPESSVTSSASSPGKAAASTNDLQKDRYQAQ